MSEDDDAETTSQDDSDRLDRELKALFRLGVLILVAVTLCAGLVLYLSFVKG